MAEMRRRETECRWPTILALGLALVLYATLPSQVPSALRIVVVVLGALIFLPVLLLNPKRLDRETRWSRLLSIAQVLLLLVANQVALVIVVRALLVGGSHNGLLILLGALQVWVTNVIAFAFAYWELDRGGPVSRRLRARDRLPRADFRFPQDEDDDTVSEVSAGSSKRSGWVAGYVDYAYFSLSNSMAFSPTDVMPLTTRAKGLMALQAVTGFVIVVLVIARAVSLVH